ncbi:MAG: GGDEF domain-containing protein [Gammaproteobacteria bacterium]|nr:GGDEF domain-containing protein [Gammaproteobacteria bacterium]
MNSHNKRQEPSVFKKNSPLLINTPLPPARLVSTQKGLTSNLNQQLFKTLDIEAQLTIFSKTIQQKVPHSALRYQNSTLKLDLIFGKSAAHHQEFKLHIDGNDLGCIGISRKKTFFATEIEQIEASLDQLLFPLRNAVLYRQALQYAFYDALTGTHNRLGMDQMLPREIQLAQRHQTPISLLIVDLDRFKRVNDTLGHQAGDALLCELTTVFRRYLRKTDLIFRYGGDEFVIALNNTDQKGANIVATRIQQGIATTPFNFKGMEINISVSIGLTEIQPDDSLDSAFCRADEALYQAKRQGRNTVVPLQKELASKLVSTP